MPFLRRGTLALGLGFLAAALVSADELTTTSGKKLSGNTVAVDKDGVTFKSDAAVVKVPPKEIVLVDLGHKVFGPGAAKHVEVELIDGSILKCSKFQIKGKKVELALFAGPEGVALPKYELSLFSVASVMRGAEDAKNRDEWRKMLANRGKRDMYVIRQADGLNFVQGTVIEGSEDGDSVVFEKEDGTRDTLRLSRATGGLVFFQKLAPDAPATLCKVVDAFGNTLTAQSVEVGTGAVVVKTVAGVTLNYSAAAALAKLDFAQGNIAYISDLDPVVSAPEPSDADKKAFSDLKGQTQPEAFTKDKRPGEGAIKLDGVTYPKGVCVAVDTVVSFNLNGDYREFKATAGFPDGAQSDGAELKLTIEADGQVIYAEKFKGNEKPKGITKDVKGVKLLRILVERDFPSEVGNYLVLADARIQK